MRTSLSLLLVLLARLHGSAMGNREEGWDKLYTGISGLKSGMGLEGTSPNLSGLDARQRRICSIPGGVFTCASPNRCCASTHTNCCNNGICCRSSDNCMANRGCCPKTHVQCGKSCCQAGAICCTGSRTLACCKAGYSCCGDTCCPVGSSCERGECLSNHLMSRIVRFDKDTAFEVLKNMCNGMRGKNTEVLTYRGKQSSSEARKVRKEAGCVRGYCSKLALPPNSKGEKLNSCDEYPPRNSLEGGNGRPRIQRAINCVPAKQNSYQGGMFSALIKKSGLKEGDQYVISIDCDAVLGSIVQRDVTTTVASSDPESTSIVGSGVADTKFPPIEGLFDYQMLVVDLGDLISGVYSITLEYEDGSTLGAFVVDNEGTELSSTGPSMKARDKQTILFTIDTELEELNGVGAIIPTYDNSTRVRWSLEGTAQSTNTSVSASVHVTQTSSVPGNNAAKPLAAGLASLIVATWAVLWSFR